MDCCCACNTCQCAATACSTRCVDAACYTQSLSPPPCICSLLIAPPIILLSQHPQPPAPALLLCTGTPLPRKAPTGSCSSGQGDSGA